MMTVASPEVHTLPCNKVSEDLLKLLNAVTWRRAPSVTIGRSDAIAGFNIEQCVGHQGAVFGRMTRGHATNEYAR